MKIRMFISFILSSMILVHCVHTNSQPTAKNPSNFPQRTLEVTQTKSNLAENSNQKNELGKRNLDQTELGTAFNPAQTPNSFNQNNMQVQGGFQPPSINSMMAGNMMMGNAMTHPMINPFSPANPFSPMSPMNPFNQVSPIAMTNHIPMGHFVTVDDDGLADDSNDLEGAADIGRDVFDDASGLRVLNKCHNVKSQAIEIANRIMRKQNNKIFKELLAYLIKGKFLIGMTEIKLTRALRKRVFGLMSAFSSLQHDQINFIDPEPEISDYEPGDEKSDESPAFDTLTSNQYYDKSFADQSYPNIDDDDKRDVAEEAADMNTKKKMNKA